MPVEPQLVENALKHYLGYYAQGDYLFHWISSSRPPHLLVMTYCGEQMFQVGGVPLPVGHWGHQLQQGPPQEYLELLTSPNAAFALGMSERQLEELLERVSVVLEEGRGGSKISSE